MDAGNDPVGQVMNEYRPAMVIVVLDAQSSVSARTCVSVLPWILLNDATSHLCQCLLYIVLCRQHTPMTDYPCPRNPIRMQRLDKGAVDHQLQSTAHASLAMNQTST